MSPAQPPLPGQPHNGRFELPELSEECKVEAVKQSLAQMSAGKGTRCGSQGPTSRIIVVSASTSDILLLNSPSTSLASCCRAATAFSRARTPSAVLLASSFSRVSSYRRERHFARGQSMAGITLGAPRRGAGGNWVLPGTLGPKLSQVLLRPSCALTSWCRELFV